MESLGQLDTALPPNELAEQALASSFRQAALSITALFKQGKRATSKGTSTVYSTAATLAGFIPGAEAERTVD